MKFKLLVNTQNEGVAFIDKCFIWKEVEKSKAEFEYVCSCNYRHRSWLDAMGVNGEIIPEKRFSNGDNCCKFKFIINTS